MSIEYTKTVRIVFMKQRASYVQVVKLLTLEKKTQRVGLTRILNRTKDRQ